MKYYTNKGCFLLGSICLVLLLALTKLNITEASRPEINFDVAPLSSASNGYGGVSINLDFENIDDMDYVYEIKRSSDYIYWQNIGLGFNYNHSYKKVEPQKIRVLNVYPDNDSFTMSDELKKIYSEKDIQNMKKVYSIQNGIYKYRDNSTANLPRSASLKIWIEGGSYSEAGRCDVYSDLSYYNGKKMLEVSQMSMKEFNSIVTASSKLKNYDTIFFGTWDANAWNDLSESAYRAVKNYIEEGHGVIFGHDTIAYEILPQGEFSGRFEHENMCKLYDIAGFKAVPKKYTGASFTKRNESGFILPVDYQIWGGSDKNNSVTVRFSKTGRAEDSALTTFPYDLLGMDGTPRNLVVPQTHTSWMGLKSERNNIVSFVDNNYDILPGITRNYYQNQPNLAYNWYLSSTSSNHSCYSIQTGHRRNESLEDERKLIANVLCSSYRKERISKIGVSGKTKVDTSAQDNAAPTVYKPEILDGDNSSFTVRFTGEDSGSHYFYYCVLNDKDGLPVSLSEEKSITITTGIEKYYYIIDNKADNYDFDIYNSNKVTVEENASGIKIPVKDIKNCNLHIKAVDYSGNVSEPVVIDMSKQILKKIYPVEVSTENEKYLYKSEDKNGIRNYYVNADSEFMLTGGCLVKPFATKEIQPYKNLLQNHWIVTELDDKLNQNNSTSGKNKKLDNLINILSEEQQRSDGSSKLKYNVTAKFADGSDGKSDCIIPAGVIRNNGKDELINATNREKLILCCDGKEPDVKYDNLNIWYNSEDYGKPFNLKLSCTDESSGFKENIVILNQYENNEWKQISKKTSVKEKDSFSFFNNAREGLFNYSIKAYDNVENIKEIRISFGVDMTAPVVNGLQESYGWTNQKVNIDVSAKDNLSGVKSLKLYDESGNIIKESNSHNIKYQFDREQNSTYYIVAEDIAGNISQKYHFQVKIDKTKPNLNVKAISEEGKIIEDSKEFYFMSVNEIEAFAEDYSGGEVCSGIVSLTLKNQKNQIVLRTVNDTDNINLNSQLSFIYEVISAADSDFYSIAAVDAAGNVSKIYVIPQLCMQNRIKRSIVHDNFEEEYGYYRIYE